MTDVQLLLQVIEWMLYGTVTVFTLLVSGMAWLLARWIKRNDDSHTRIYDKLDQFGDKLEQISVKCHRNNAAVHHLIEHHEGIPPVPEEES